MWAQEWTNIYPLVEPYPGVSSLDVTRELEAQRWDVQQDGEARRELLHRAGAGAVAGHLLDALACSPSRATARWCATPRAWDVTYSDDLRIKMCIRPEEEDLITIHHELGHNYY